MCSINNAILSILVFSLSVAAVVCLPLGSFRIFYGEEAEKGQFPYQVALNLHGDFICGGSILSHRFVLTAAHCIKKGTIDSPEIYKVLVRKHSRNSGQLYRVNKLFVHKDFSMHDSWWLSDMYNDIALIELRTSIEFSKNVAPIELNREFIPDNVTVVLSGYGSTENSTDIANLNYVYLNTLKNCDGARVRTNTTLCARAVKDIGGAGCVGDSGGPLAYNNTLVGIFSWGPKNCDLNIPNGYTRVSLFVDWVEETIRNAVEN